MVESNNPAAVEWHEIFIVNSVDYKATITQTIISVYLAKAEVQEE